MCHHQYNSYNLHNLYSSSAGDNSYTPRHWLLIRTAGCKCSTSPLQIHSCCLHNKGDTWVHSVTGCFNLQTLTDCQSMSCTGRLFSLPDIRPGDNNQELIRAFQINLETCSYYLVTSYLLLQCIFLSVYKAPVRGLVLFSFSIGRYRYICLTKTEQRPKLVKNSWV